MERAPKILFVEDEESILNSLGFILEEAGYTVLKAVDGESGLRLAFDQPPDLAILDIMLPGMNGLEVAKRLKGDPRTAAVRIMMLTGRMTEQEMIAALETVADDYLPKPVKPRVVLARIQAMFRRDPHALPATELVCGPIRIDRLSRSVAIDGGRVTFTRSEFDMLDLFLSHPDRVFSRDQIIAVLRGDDFAVTARSVDFLVFGIRKKLGRCAAKIETVRGIGFKFVPA